MAESNPDETNKRLLSSHIRTHKHTVLAWMALAGPTKSDHLARQTQGIELLTGRLKIYLFPGQHLVVNSCGESFGSVGKIFIIPDHKKGFICAQFMNLAKKP